MSVSAAELQGKALSAPLPDIHLTDIGKKSGGATAGEVAQQVLAAVGQAATRAATSLPDVGKLVGSAKEEAAGAAKGAGGGLKKLFGK